MGTCSTKVPPEKVELDQACSTKAPPAELNQACLHCIQYRDHMRDYVNYIMQYTQDAAAWYRDHPDAGPRGQSGEIGQRGMGRGGDGNPGELSRTGIRGYPGPCGPPGQSLCNH